MPKSLGNIQVEFDVDDKSSLTEQEQLQHIVAGANALVHSNGHNLNVHFSVMLLTEDDVRLHVAKPTLEELLEGQDLSTFTINTNCLEDMICPWCLNRDKLLIRMASIFSLWDNGTGDHNDTEWDQESYCECANCNRHGKVKDFEFEGLDELLKKHQAK